MKTTNQHIQIAHRLEDNRFADSPYVKVDFVLKAFDKTYRGTDLHKRFGICLIIEGREGRQVCQGPMVPGPWARTFGLCTTICSDTSQNTGAVSARNIEAKTEAIVVDGDTVELDGQIYVVRLRRDFSELRMDLELVVVTDAELATELAVTAADQAEAILVLQDKLNAAEGRSHRLEGYIENYKADARKLERDLADAEATNRGLNQALNMEVAARQELQTKLADADATQDYLKRNTEGADKETRRAQAEVETYRATNARLLAENQRVAAELQKVRAACRIIAG